MHYILYVCYGVEVGDDSPQKSHGRNLAPHGDLGIWSNRRLDVARPIDCRHPGGSDSGFCADPMEKQTVSTLLLSALRFKGIRFGVSPCCTDT